MVGSFYSSEMIICIHIDNLLIPRHLICSHDFKKHINNVSMRLQPSSSPEDACWRKYIYFISQVVKKQFGHTNNQKNITSIIVKLLSSLCRNNTGFVSQIIGN